ncbi:peptidase M24, structural domain-containing protein [Plectosphaerella cucumerina]|uniref:Methionine aminopeptidase 2 n=1 Tax=Plectosphaerella cucumerina TaxID=40658 RepID=A0A8K0X916_9PEZI|nr:peptidase M24, structural domain-containing protein [Plectosphaerella cucumerina]
MGAKSPEDQIPGSNDDGPLSSTPGSGGEPRGSHHARDGDGLDGDDDDDDDADEAAVAGSVPLTGEGADKKKKKKKPKKKKKTKAKAPTDQSCPPRVPLSDLFAAGQYPAGELQDYNTARTTPAEVRRDARRQIEDPTFLDDYRRAAEVHRQVRYWVQENVRPGQTLLEIANGIEDGVRALLGHQGLEKGDSLIAGMGFPTGLCINNHVAHYTPNPGDKDVVLKHEDVMKVDYGVHVNGWIVDSAFTMSFDPVFDNLLDAARAATNAGIKAAGIDVRICDVSAEIQDTMESYEVEIGGKMFPVKAVRNINAHDIQHWHIHGGKAIPFIRNNDETKMEEGEIFAIETFGTTGCGRLYDDVGIYGYGLRPDIPKNVDLPFTSAKRLHKVIREQFGPLVFNRRYLDRLGLDRYLAGLSCLVSHGVLEAYEPLADIRGSYSAQFEHTILLRESSKEILSRGSDY